MRFFNTFETSDFLFFSFYLDKVTKTHENVAFLMENNTFRNQHRKWCSHLDEITISRSRRGETTLFLILALWFEKSKVFSKNNITIKTKNASRLDESAKLSKVLYFYSPKSATKKSATKKRGAIRGGGESSFSSSCHGTESREEMGLSLGRNWGQVEEGPRIDLNCLQR